MIRWRGLRFKSNLPTKKIKPSQGFLGEIMSNPLGGTPATFKEPKDFAKQLKLFFKWCEEKDKIPFIVSFAYFCRMPLSTLEGYRHRKGFEHLYEIIKTASHHQVLQGGMQKLYSDKITHLVLKNHHNYDAVDKVENENQTTTKIEIVLAEPPK